MVLRVEAVQFEHAILSVTPLSVGVSGGDVEGILWSKGELKCVWSLS